MKKFLLCEGAVCCGVAGMSSQVGILATTRGASQEAGPVASDITL